MEQNQQKTYEKSSLETTKKIDSCSCNKKQCILGISSISIGIGGFLLASLL